MSPLAAMKRAMINNSGSHFAFFLRLLSVLALAATAQHTLAQQDLFGSDPGSSTAAPTQEMIAPSSDDSSEMAEPAISATDAALRAQQHVAGKVMNVRQFQDENKTLYGVKVLQQNGRIRTINIDANSGSIVE